MESEQLFQESETSFQQVIRLDSIGLIKLSFQLPCSFCIVLDLQDVFYQLLDKRTQHSNLDTLVE